MRCRTAGGTVVSFAAATHRQLNSHKASLLPTSLKSQTYTMSTNQKRIAGESSSDNPTADPSASASNDESSTKRIKTGDNPSDLAQNAKPAEDKGKAKAMEVEEEDSFGDQLICGICHEILYKAVSLIPCLHTFCAACYSDWLVVSDRCPSCRDTAQAVRTNHLLNNVIDVYLKQQPDKARTEEEKKECDTRNKLQKELVTGSDFKKLVLSRLNSINENEDDENEDEDEDEDEDAHGHDPYYMFGHSSFLVPCRSCAPGNLTGYNCTHSIAPSHPEIATPLPPSTTLPIPAGHVVCSQCHYYMPARGRPTALAGSGASVEQSCCFCKTIYCDAYWGCSKSRDHFKKLSEFTFTVLPPINTLRVTNTFEFESLKDYLRDTDYSVEDTWKECLRMMDEGVYISSHSALDGPAHDLFPGFLPTGGAPPAVAPVRDEDEDEEIDDAAGPAAVAPPATPNVSESVYACLSCVTRVFAGQLYGFWRDVPRDQLPDAISTREDCWYGRNCRTQWHSYEHAKRLNHICEATRH